MHATDVQATVMIRVGEHEGALDAARAQGFLGLFTAATEHATYAAVFRGLAGVIHLPTDEPAPVTIGSQTFSPPQA